MYVIIASQVDDDAAHLASQLPEEEFRILTPSDLSRPGWSVVSGNDADSTFVAAGQQYQSRELRGVLCRLPCVFAPELVQISEQDREYVASEMTAFLRYWLFTLACPVLNPPTAGCLSGPNWRREQWNQAARDAGLRTQTLSRSTTGDGASVPPTGSVTLIGQRPLGECPAALLDASRALCARAGVSLLSITFREDPANGFVFQGADTFPPLAGSRAAQLVVEHFQAR